MLKPNSKRATFQTSDNQASAWASLFRTRYASYARTHLHKGSADFADLERALAVGDFVELHAICLHRVCYLIRHPAEHTHQTQTRMNSHTGTHAHNPTRAAALPSVPLLVHPRRHPG